MVDSSTATIEVPSLLFTAFEHMEQGVGVFDSALRLVAYNRQFREMRGYPEDLCQLGVPLESLLR